MSREKEPDNNFRRTSQELFHKKSVQGTYYSKKGKDVDYYFVKFSEPKMLSGELTGIKGVDAQILLFRKGYSQPIKVIDDTGSSSTEAFGPIWFDKPGVIICIEPKHQHNSKDYMGLYYKFTPEVYSVSNPSEKEPNDSFMEANEIKGVIYGYYSNIFLVRSRKKISLEKDFFKVKLEEAKKYRLSIELSGVDGIDPVLYLYGEDENEIRVIDNQFINKGEVLPNYGVFGPKTLYVGVAAKDRKINLSEYYKINIASEEFQDKYEFEPNEDFDTASPLMDEITEGEIGSSKDIDFYAYTNKNSNNTPLHLRFELIPSQNLDPKIFVYDKNQNFIFQIDDGGMGKMEGISNLPLAFGQKIYFKVMPSKVETDSYPLSYEIQFSDESPADGFEIEPNNSINTANPILISATNYGYLNPNNDQDYFKIKENGLKSVQQKILLTGVRGCKIQLSLADKRGVIIRTESAKRWNGDISIIEQISDNQIIIVQCKEYRANLYQSSYELSVKPE